QRHGIRTTGELHARDGLRRDWWSAIRAGDCCGACIRRKMWIPRILASRLGEQGLEPVLARRAEGDILAHGGPVPGAPGRRVGEVEADVSKHLAASLLARKHPRD